MNAYRHRHHEIFARVYPVDSDKCFCVSTIIRQSSSPVMSDFYHNETFVWEENEKKGLVNIVLQQDDSKNSIATHNKICEELYLTGKLESFKNKTTGE